MSDRECARAGQAAEEDDDAIASSHTRERFDEDGFVFARGLLDLERDIVPLQRELGALIEQAARACGVRHRAPADPADFDHGYLALVAVHPEVQPVVYDMAKNLISFQRLIVCEPLVRLFHALRDSSLCGTAPGANGVRIDSPGVTRHLAPWHQEFQYQFRSLDGVTFWLPLVPVTAAMGPVVLAPGSHRAGALPLVDTTGTAESDMDTGAYGGLRLADEATITERYDVCAPLSRPGDVLALDFLTLHASGANLGTRSRWTAQIRFFNFNDAYGTSIRWSGGVKHGASLEEANARVTEARRLAKPRRSR